MPRSTLQARRWVHLCTHAAPIDVAKLILAATNNISRRPRPRVPRTLDCRGSDSPHAALATKKTSALVAENHQRAGSLADGSPTRSLKSVWLGSHQFRFAPLRVLWIQPWMIAESQRARTVSLVVLGCWKSPLLLSSRRTSPSSSESSCPTPSSQPLGLKDILPAILNTLSNS